ncbi:MAG: 4a-hydroxytetrahydrobiopterin dehydratase [Dokdonella sp.]
MSLPDLLHSHCIPRKGAEHALEPDAIAELLATVSDWQLNADGLGISRKFTFTDFHQTMAFVNAVAWIAHQEDHHPDMDVGYAHCALLFSTHDVGGLSLNDFICAAKVTQLLERG